MHEPSDRSPRRSNVGCSSRAVAPRSRHDARSPHAGTRSARPNALVSLTVPEQRLGIHDTSKLWHTNGIVANERAHPCGWTCSDRHEQHGEA